MLQVLAQGCGDATACNLLLQRARQYSHRWEEWDGQFHTAEWLIIYGQQADDIPQRNTAELAAIMAATPTWAPGLPLSAAGFEADRYRKD
jgi:hypothetical protein